MKDYDFHSFFNIRTSARMGAEIVAKKARQKLKKPALKKKGKKESNIKSLQIYREVLARKVTILNYET